MGKKLVVLLCLGWLSANTLAKNVELIAHDKHTALVRTSAVYHRLTVRQTASGSVVVDTLYYFQPPRSNADYSDYLGNHQSAGDTCINWFTLLAPGKVTKLMMQNMTGGTANWFLWAPAITNEKYQFPDDSGLVQLLDQPAGWPCLKLNMAQQTMDSLVWNTYDLAIENHVVELDSSQLDFWVGYRLDSGGNPKIYQDDVYHYQWSEGSCRSFTTISDSGSGRWFGNFQPGTDNWVAHMMQVEVIYEAIPPIILELPDLCDTFAESRTIWAEVVEIEGDNFGVYLCSKAGINGQLQERAMDHDTLNYFWANLEYNPGDTIYYYVRAEDSTMAQCSEWKSFICITPPADTNILLIDNSGLQTGNRYRDALNQLGFEYFYWNLDKHKGIDTTVIFYPEFLTLVVLDGDEMILPVTDIKNQDIYNIAGFLNSGGNLLLVDMDYFYRWDFIGEGNFESGDFAYDYLGIEDFESDPDNDYNPENGGIADTLLLSVVNNPVTSAFAVDTAAYGPIRYQIGDSAILNWADFIEPSNEGRQILRGKSSKRGLAVCLNGEDFRTATFCVPIELADSTGFSSLLDSTLAWLNDNTTRLQASFTRDEGRQPAALSSSFRLLGAYPNPFNPVTTISFELLKRDQVTLRVFNLLGEEVAEIVNGEMNPGKYSVTWTARSEDGRELPSGIYICRLHTTSQSAAKKMVLMR